jgi:DNA-binding transcriptional regulator LsrR (DeoR family)
MIEPDKRKAIFLLHQEGMPARQIAQQLRVSRPTVKTIIAQEGQNPEVARSLPMQTEASILSQLQFPYQLVADIEVFLETVQLEEIR